ncbi:MULTISPECIES: FeoB-associated Cys-rich membrane protein [Clostridium]|nr:MULTISPECIES: FeoB-associated Cys-rich membrane protein [Clostridium]MCD2345746.1 FeoB-associated Cys-rich membrane protein [Clostridium guangxiense]
MILELIITALIIFTALFIFIKNIKKSSHGSCNCSSCPSKTKSCCNKNS